jgi:hypothetical protein
MPLSLVLSRPGSVPVLPRLAGSGCGATSTTNRATTAATITTATARKPASRRTRPASRPGQAAALGRSGHPKAPGPGVLRVAAAKLTGPPSAPCHRRRAPCRLGPPGADWQAEPPGSRNAKWCQAVRSAAKPSSHQRWEEASHARQNVENG